jgi:hypothetical protein
MPIDGTIGYLVGKLQLLRIECPTCGRQGRYHVARLLDELPMARAGGNGTLAVRGARWT